MVTLTTADNALKNIYLGVVANELNTTSNPLYNQIINSTSDVWGKNIIKLAPHGMNGGVGAGTEDGSLPVAGESKYMTLNSSLKNLYGKIEISDKAIRASANDTGAFVNLLNAEMEGLLSASKFNLARMLYGDGSGVVASITSATLAEQTLKVDSIRNIMEGMIVDFYKQDVLVPNLSGVKILSIDHSAKQITISAFFDATFVSSATSHKMYVQGSKDNELTGLDAIFNVLRPTLYGLNKEDYSWMNPYNRPKLPNETFDEELMQAAIDEVSRKCDSVIDFIVCDNATRRMYQKYLSTQKMNIDFMELKGGQTAISFNGIPLVADKLAQAGKMYMLATKDFCLHQLCDWQWLEGEDGSILKQKAGYPTYSATLVKYADLICSKPGGQAVLTNLV